jgi:hypothetical protein
VQRDGKTIVREKKISLHGGEIRKITIDFPTSSGATIAANR